MALIKMNYLILEDLIITKGLNQINYQISTLTNKRGSYKITNVIKKDGTPLNNN